jgi:hypothetical protein
MNAALLLAVAAPAGLLLATLAGWLLVRHGHHWTDAVAIEGIAAIGAIGWLQSYVSLHALALRSHEPGWEAATWPAVLDVFALVMGLAAVRARWEGQPRPLRRGAGGRLLAGRHRGQRLDLAARPGDGRRARPAAVTMGDPRITDQVSRRRAAGASAKEGVRLVVYQGRSGQVGCSAWPTIVDSPLPSGRKGRQGTPCGTLPMPSLRSAATGRCQSPIERRSAHGVP